jgi:hypothetical protein
LYDFANSSLLIFRDGWHEPLQPTSEVFLLPRMVGG